jgi:hypothetical protein
MAMAASVIVTGAMAAHEPMIIIDGYDVYIGHEFVAIVAIAIIVITAIFADVIVISYIVLSSPEFFPTLAAIDLFGVIHLRFSFPAHGGFFVRFYCTTGYIGAQVFSVIFVVD